MNILKFLKAQFRSSTRFTPAECASQVRSGAAVLVDVREPKEWSAGVAELAVLLPLSDLAGRRKRWQPFLAAHDGRELLLYCGAGVRSAMAAKTLAAEGFNATNAGSFSEWMSAGWPVLRPTVAAGNKTP